MADKKIQSAEAKALKAFREKQERKYGKIAKKRLAILSEKLQEGKLIVDMTDAEFDTFVNTILAYKDAYKRAREPQQQSGNPFQPQQQPHQ